MDKLLEMQNFVNDFNKDFNLALKIESTFDKQFNLSLNPSLEDLINLFNTLILDNTSLKEDFLDYKSIIIDFNTKCNEIIPHSLYEFKDHSIIQKEYFLVENLNELYELLQEIHLDNYLIKDLNNGLNEIIEKYNISLNYLNKFNEINNLNSIP